MADGLIVVGGPGSTAVHTAELRAVAGRLGEVAVDLAAAAVAVTAAVTRSEVLLAAAVVPGRGHRALAGCAELVARLTGCATGCAVLSGALLLSADAYDHGEAAAAAAVGGALGSAARSAALAPGPLPDLLLLAAAAGGVLFVGPDPETAGRRVARHPGGVAAAVRVLPTLLGVRDPAQLARLAVALGPVVGLVAETGVRVQEPDRGPARNVRPAAGLSELLLRNQAVSATSAPVPDPPQRGHVRVDEVRGPDGARSWVVHVPGTQEWDVDGVGPPTDMTSNLRAVAGLTTAAELAVVLAMRRAGVRRGQPVLLVGHSQGGLTVTGVASARPWQDEFSITHVLTAGAPVAGATPLAGVQVLSIEHTDDLVPALEGAPNPAREHWTTVSTTAPTGGPWDDDAVPAHSSAAYAETAHRLDSSEQASVAAFRTGLAVFLDRPGASVVSHDVVAVRQAPPARPR